MTNEEGDVNNDEIKDVLISEEELMKWSVACLMKVKDISSIFYIVKG